MENETPKNMIKLIIPQKTLMGYTEINIDTEFYIEEELYDKYIEEGKTVITVYMGKAIFFTPEEFRKVKDFLNLINGKKNILLEVENIIKGSNPDSDAQIIL